jgi:hypothetical protein
VATKIIATRKRPCGDHKHVDSILTLDRRTYTRAEAVTRIEGGWEAFYTEYQGDTANVYVRRGNCGVKYITTKPDGTVYNNLLKLPDF